MIFNTNIIVEHKMDLLPIEITGIILSNFDTVQVLLNVRLVNKTFQCLASEDKVLDYTG